MLYRKRYVLLGKGRFTGKSIFYRKKYVLPEKYVSPEKVCFTGKSMLYRKKYVSPEKYILPEKCVLLEKVCFTGKKYVFYFFTQLITTMQCLQCHKLTQPTSPIQLNAIWQSILSCHCLDVYLK